jgi:Xaa-Pro aminopeptidase
MSDIPSQSEAFMNLRLILLTLSLSSSAPNVSAQIDQSEYAARRDSLLARIDSGVVVAIGAREPVTEYRFVQIPGFHYLTGFDEPGAALVMVKRAATTTATMFVAPRDLESERFTGPRATPQSVTALNGLPASLSDQFLPRLDSLAGMGLPLYVVRDVATNDFARADTFTFGTRVIDSIKRAHPTLVVEDARRPLNRIRARKSAAEMALIRQAVEITDEGHRAAIRAVRPGRYEYEIQAAAESEFLRRGAERPSYASIVAAGANANVFHYDQNASRMRSGELVLMDMGAEYHGYAADVTRTVPVSGHFTGDQRRLYQLVRDLQTVAERNVKVGGPVRAAYDSARGLLKVALTRLGLIESPDAVYDAPWGKCRPMVPLSLRAGMDTMPRECPQWDVFGSAGIDHGIGLEVHDPAQYYYDSTFAVGDAFTIEPGIYVDPRFLATLPDTPRNRTMLAKIRPAVERYKNIGIRIEDDYLITERGLERVSLAPREVREIEALAPR